MGKQEGAPGIVLRVDALEGSLAVLGDGSLVALTPGAVGRAGEAILKNLPPDGIRLLEICQRVGLHNAKVDAERALAEAPRVATRRAASAPRKVEQKAAIRAAVERVQTGRARLLSEGELLRNRDLLKEFPRLTKKRLRAAFGKSY